MSETKSKTQVEETKKKGIKELFFSLLKGSKSKQSSPSTPTTPQQSIPKEKPEAKEPEEKEIRRVLTTPPTPVSNHLKDNSEHNLIVKQGDLIRGRYLAVDRVGKGVYGQVFGCVDQKRNRRVALKVIKNQPHFRRQAKCEVAILEELNEEYDVDRKNIVRVFDIFTHHDHICIVFELLGKNLFEMIQANKYMGMPVDDVARIVRQILVCLHVMWKSHIIHCDLKPENVLLGKDLPDTTPLEPKVLTPSESRVESKSRYPVKVIDLGSACFEHSTTSWYVQSRFYRAPEVILGNEYGCAIDMWSLGCMVIELLLGLPIFPGNCTYNMIRQFVRLMGVPPAHVIDGGRFSVKFFEQRVDADTQQEKYVLKTAEQFRLDTGESVKENKYYFPEDDLLYIVLNNYTAGKPQPSDEELGGMKRDRLSCMRKLEREWAEKKQKQSGGPASPPVPITPDSKKKKGINGAVGAPDGAAEQTAEHSTSSTTTTPLSPQEKQVERLLALVDFVKGLLVWDSRLRWSADQALAHPFLTGEDFVGYFEPPVPQQAKRKIGRGRKQRRKARTSRSRQKINIELKLGGGQKVKLPTAKGSKDIPVEDDNENDRAILDRCVEMYVERISSYCGPMALIQFQRLEREEQETIALKRLGLTYYLKRHPVLRHNRFMKEDFKYETKKISPGTIGSDPIKSNELLGSPENAPSQQKASKVEPSFSYGQHNPSIQIQNHKGQQRQQQQQQPNQYSPPLQIQVSQQHSPQQLQYQMSPLQIQSPQQHHPHQQLSPLHNIQQQHSPLVPQISPLQRTPNGKQSQYLQVPGQRKRPNNTFSYSEKPFLGASPNDNYERKMKAMYLRRMKGKRNSNNHQNNNQRNGFGMRQQNLHGQGGRVQQAQQQQQSNSAFVIGNPTQLSFCGGGGYNMNTMGGRMMRDRMKKGKQNNAIQMSPGGFMFDVGSVGGVDEYDREGHGESGYSNSGGGAGGGYGRGNANAKMHGSGNYQGMYVSPKNTNRRQGISLSSSGGGYGSNGFGYQQRQRQHQHNHQHQNQNQNQRFSQGEFVDNYSISFGSSFGDSQFANLYHQNKKRQQQQQQQSGQQQFPINVKPRSKSGHYPSFHQFSPGNTPQTQKHKYKKSRNITIKTKKKKGGYMLGKHQQSYRDRSHTQSGGQRGYKKRRGSGGFANSGRGFAQQSGNYSSSYDDRHGYVLGSPQQLQQHPSGNMYYPQESIRRHHQNISKRKARRTKKGKTRS